MSYDNRIISSEPYIINIINTDNRISKRPPSRTPISRNKKQNSSNEFDEKVNSFPDTSKRENNNTTENSDFENQLYNLSLTKNKTIINKLDSNNKDSSSPNPTKKIVDSELHAKISQAMNVEVDVSTIYEKIKLLNSLKK